MIIGSIALVAVSAVLWVIGVRENSDLWFYASIVGSVLAAFALIVGVRQKARSRIPEDEFDVDPFHRAPDTIPTAPRPTGRAAVSRQPTVPVRAPETVVHRAGADTMPERGPEPPDEPPPEVITEREASRVAAMTAEVAVVDGRPRYHAAGCLHLLGREAERLPVGDATALGFTPCGQCEPAHGLLATTPRP